MLLLLGAVGCILLIACANVANLQLARALHRRREIAVRLAMGATRGQLTRLIFIESLLLASLGAGAGLLVAFGGIAILRSLLLRQQQYPYEITFSAPVLAFSLLITIATSILFSFAPVILSRQTEINEALNNGGGLHSGNTGSWPRRTLVVSEVALCLLMLVAFGLLGHSFLHLLEMDLGFAPEQVLTARIGLPERYQEKQTKLFAGNLLERIRSLPGAESAGVASALPLEGATGMVPMQALPEHTPLGTLPLEQISPGYLHTMGIRLVAGRDFTVRDNQTSPPVALVNASLAQQIFGRDDPIGARLQLGQEVSDRSVATIVGVIGDIHQFGLETSVKPAVLVPFDQAPSGYMALAIRTTSSSQGLAAAVRNQVRALDSSVPVFDIAVMPERVASQLAPRRSLLMLMGSFALLALCLAAVGIYGVITYSVAQRRREIAIRMAIGATKERVMALIIRQGLSLVLAGAALGLIAALALARYMATLLYGTSPFDPLTFASAFLLLIAVAILASYLPARRAANADPVTALREE